MTFIARDSSFTADFYDFIVWEKEEDRSFDNSIEQEEVKEGVKKNSMLEWPSEHQL